MKKMERPSTFQYWDMEASGEIKEISVDQFLIDNPGYESGYTQAYNACKTAGCNLIDKVWTDPKGITYENVFDCHDNFAKIKLKFD